MALRPHTGRIDLNYKPFPTWSVYPRPVGGVETWFADFPGNMNYFIGDKREFHYDGDPATYVGLRRTGSSSIPNISYDHRAHRAVFGEWASLIQPTSFCESEAKFFVINAWDRAGMTFGFFQLAAHTGSHLANLFRELLTAIPNEADRFFPELKLGSQIGNPNRRNIFAVNGAEHLDLDVAVAPTDGLHFEAYYRGRFMEFFNPNRAALDREEAVASARWIAWLTTSDAARKVCVQNAVNTAKQAVKTVHSDVKQRGHPKYPHGLHNVAMNLAAAAMDVKHHGRKNDGESTLDSIFNALIDDDPLKKFSEIATGWRRDRSKRSVTEIGRMQGWFDGKVYDAVVEDFRPVVA